MRVAFRVDAGLPMATGHVMRCVTLANALRNQGANCLFLSRPHTGHLMDWIAEQGHGVVALREPDVDTVHGLGKTEGEDAAEVAKVLREAPPDWVVTDHYGIGEVWEKAVRPFSQRLMAIDDLANRPHDCDLLLDQNLGKTPAHYGSQVSGATQVLAGERYALLRPEFLTARRALARPKMERKDARLQVLLSLGGIDKDNLTESLLRALSQSPLTTQVAVTVVLGHRSPWIGQIRDLLASSPIQATVLVGVSDMAKVMASADVAIGAAGTSALERCCVGLPSLMILMAANQEFGTRALEAAGAAVAVSEPRALLTALQGLMQEGKLTRMREKAWELVDGLGTGRVVEAMYAFH
jgi:UDP-2,4-diacetamido-2,4,6-trideoxy-beta-L-altropyranose hydrolase